MRYSVPFCNQHNMNNIGVLSHSYDEYNEHQYTQPNDRDV